MAKRTALSPLPSTEMQLWVETVTPEQAKQWLDVDNSRNRKIRDSRVSYLSDEITTGRFHLTHMGIAFDPKGNLLDGQHRLAAIVKAGVPIEIVVARNVAPESYIAMDRGSIRSIADVLRQDQRSTAVASTIVRHIELRSYDAPSAPEDVKLILDALEAEIQLANSVRLLRPLSRIQLRCALALRLAAAETAHREALMEQWQALNKNDTPVIDATSAALMRRLLTDRGQGVGREGRGRLMTLAWQAFDPTQRNRQQFHIDAAAYREMQIATRRIIRGRCPLFNPNGSRLERALAAGEPIEDFLR